MDALILGFSSGSSCLASCAPFIVPILAIEGSSRRSGKAIMVALFLLGRLAAYAIVGLAVGGAGSLAAGYMSPALERVMARLGWALGGAVLLAGGLAGIKGPAFCGVLAARERPRLSAIALGLAAGLNLCPPFIAAIGRAAGLGALGGLLFFGLFFVGTSAWLLPLGLFPSLKRHGDELKATARAAMILLGSYYLAILGVLGWY